LRASYGADLKMGIIENLIRGTQTSRVRVFYF